MDDFVVLANGDHPPKLIYRKLGSRRQNARLCRDVDVRKTTVWFLIVLDEGISPSAPRNRQTEIRQRLERYVET